MSPFLAQVRLINVAGHSGGSADFTIQPEVHAQIDDALGTIHAIADEVIEEARAAAHAAVAEAQKSDGKIGFEARSDKSRAREEAANKQAALQAKEDSDDKDDSSDVTINNGTKSIVVHHGKSHDDFPVAVVPALAITFTFLWLIVRALMAPFTNRAKRGSQVTVSEGLSAEETAILEKLQRTLAQMESRVESLETILIDTARTK